MDYKYHCSSLKRALDLLYANSLTSAKERCNKKNRSEAGEHTIKDSYLEELYEKQNGLCYYSNIPMNFDKSEWKVSIERLDNTKGYIEGNIVLCCLELNTGAKWSLEKVDQAVKSYDSFVFKPVPPRKRKTYNKFPQRIVSTGRHCVYCDEVKTVKEFSALSTCKLCHNEHQKICRSTARGALSRLISNARTSSNIRMKNEGKSDRTVVDIDLEFIIDLYEKQKGRCAYSGIPLQFGSCKDNDWVMSLERLDITKGYTADNVCLICVEFNSCDQSKKTGLDYGRAGWSRLKFELFVAHVKFKKGLISKEELQATIDRQVEVKSRPLQGSYNEQLNNPLKPKLIYKKRKHAHEDLPKLLPQQKRNYGSIYIITSPDGKQFVGKTETLNQADYTIYCDIKRLGYKSITNAIDKYGIENMKFETFLTCEKHLLAHFQETLINELKTSEPNGLNNTIKVKDETKTRISQTLIANRKRFGHNGQELPKYIRFINWADRKGYGIVSHPKCKKMDFASTAAKVDLDVEYQRCTNYLNTL